jgi:hypothetical protein
MEGVNLYRPHATQPSEIRLAIEALACNRCNLTATYVAVPITGGPRFVAWYESVGSKLDQQSPEYKTLQRREVIEPNCESAQVAIKSILARDQGRVIDPSQFEAPRWTQDDYRNFWSQVIERFAARAIFLDGWHLSSGCIYEFLVTSTLGIPTLKSDFSPLTFTNGFSRVKEGLSEMTRIKADSRFFQKIMNELTDYAKHT